MSAVSCQSPWLALAAGQPERPVHDTERSRPVAVILRPGKTQKDGDWAALRSEAIFTGWFGGSNGIGL